MRAHHALVGSRGQPLPLPESLLCLSVGSGPWEAQRKWPCFRGCGMAGRSLAWGRGQKENRNYSGPFSPSPTAPRGSDGKRPSCLHGKDVSCAGLGQAEPPPTPGAHHKPFPAVSAPQSPRDRAPPRAFNCPHPSSLGSRRPNQESKHQTSQA